MLEHLRERCLSLIDGLRSKTASTVANYSENRAFLAGVKGALRLLNRRILISNGMVFEDGKWIPINPTQWCLPHEVPDLLKDDGIHMTWLTNEVEIVIQYCANEVSGPDHPGFGPLAWVDKQASWLNIGDSDPADGFVFNNKLHGGRVTHWRLSAEGIRKIQSLRQIKPIHAQQSMRETECV
jgi:hypothetical protein